MIRATVGNWANYATTLVAQILFASHFGSSRDAAAFTIAFALATSISGILASVVQTIAVPRLVVDDGRVRRTLIPFLVRMTCVAFAIGGTCALLSSPAAPELARVTGMSAARITLLLAAASGVLVLRFMATEIGLIGFALGQRLVPSLAPAVPSTAMAGAFLVSPHIGVVEVMVIFMLASLVEAVLLAVFIALRIRLTDDPLRPVRGMTIRLIGAGILLSILAPMERILAGINSAADAARYDYAIRSLTAVQVLVTGGIAIAALANWSRPSSKRLHAAFQRSVATTSLLSGYALAFGAAAFILVGRDLTGLVYQHGQFTAGDTVAVSTIISIALVGNVAQGASSVMVSALAADHRAADLATIAVVQFGARTALGIPLGLMFGAKGLAISYSAGSALGLFACVRYLLRAHLWSIPPGLWQCLAKGSLASACAVTVIAIVGPNWPAIVRLAVLSAVFVAANRSLPRAAAPSRAVVAMG